MKRQIDYGKRSAQYMIGRNTELLKFHPQKCDVLRLSK